jgi:hypothetical protein
MWELVSAPPELDKLVEMARSIPCAPSAVMAFWMRLTLRHMEGKIFQIFWLIVGFSAFATGGEGGVYMAGPD